MSKLSACLLFFFGLLGIVQAEDWPMWRYDAHRSSASPQDLAPELHLQWVRHLPALTLTACFTTLYHLLSALQGGPLDRVRVFCRT